MKPASAREKGKRLERAVAKLLRTKGLDPPRGDYYKGAQRTPMSGAMSQWKGDILTDLPLHIECKNQERITFWKFWAQASEQCPLGQDPVLVISANNRPIVAVVDIDFLLNLLKTEKDYLSEVSGEW